jgi:hypothetical protein
MDFRITFSNQSMIIVEMAKEAFLFEISILRLALDGTGPIFDIIEDFF